MTTLAARARRSFRRSLRQRPARRGHRPRARQPDRRAHRLQRWLRPADGDRSRHRGGLRAAPISMFASTRQCPARPASCRRFPTVGPRDWSDYIAGAIWAMAQADLRVAGADLAIVGDIPVGAGLSSSAALELATLQALCACAGIDWHPTRMAHLARAAENDFVGVACGVMDQFASALGVEGGALLLDCRWLKWKTVPIPSGRARRRPRYRRPPRADDDGLQRSARSVRTSRDRRAHALPRCAVPARRRQDDARESERSHGSRGVSTGASCRGRDAAARGDGVGARSR